MPTYPITNPIRGKRPCVANLPISSFQLHNSQPLATSLFTTHHSMNRILSFTDGSPYAASVYDHSAWAASQLNAQLRLINTLNPHQEKAAFADFSGKIGPDAMDSLLDDLVAVDRERARLSQIKGDAILAEAKSHLEKTGQSNVSAELRHGLFVDVLEDLHETFDLIVIGKRGKRHASDMKHLGTNIERTLRVAKCPVLVASREFKPIKKALLAHNGCSSSNKALDYIIAHPLFKDVQIELLRVGTDNEKNRAELEAAANKLRSAGFETNVILKEGEPAKVITAEVETKNFDLLAMGAYSHSRAKRFLIGSTTATLARDCHIPILMFR